LLTRKERFWLSIQKKTQDHSFFFKLCVLVEKVNFKQY